MSDFNTAVVDDFIKRQLVQWPIAASNFANLETVLTRDVTVNGFPMKLQCNPARIVSGAAKTDKVSLEKRPCFLCRENRDTRQISIIWTDSLQPCYQYEVLVNLYPVFPGHLVIAAAHHVYQNAATRITSMVLLARQLPGYTVFYNGTQAGASAPDHQHFQAVPSHFLPLWNWVDSTRFDTLEATPGAQIGEFGKFPYHAFAINLDKEAGKDVIDKALDTLMSLAMNNDTAIFDSKCNIFVRDIQGNNQLIVVKRVKHRPSMFTTSGNDGFLISPGAIDMAGVFILPRLVDYERLDATTIAKIIDEVVVP